MPRKKAPAAKKKPAAPKKQRPAAAKAKAKPEGDKIYKD